MTNLLNAELESEALKYEAALILYNLCFHKYMIIAGQLQIL
jgi:hypothetical protein